MKTNKKITYFISLLLFISVFIGCATGPKVSKVCPAPEGKESWLCDRSAELEITLEQVYGWIYTPVAGGVVFDKLDREEICDFDKKLADWYVKSYPFTYEKLILEVFNQLKALDDPMKVALLANILNRNLNFYTSPDMIKEYDDWMIRAGNKQFRQDMFCD